MFARRPDSRPGGGAPLVEVFVEGAPVRVLQGASAAAAVLIAGAFRIRETPVSGAPRLPYCMMGVCFDCLSEIDGVPNRQACLVPAVPGMRIAVQHGARRPGDPAVSG